MSELISKISGRGAVPPPASLRARPTAPIILPLRQFVDPLRGELGVAEVGQSIPFAVQRAFWIRDVPPGAHRAGHAHRKLQQFFIALRGSVLIQTRCAKTGTERYQISGPTGALYVPPMTWVDCFDFDSDTILLVLCDRVYDPNDYIKSEYDFHDAVKGLCPTD